jgi:acyl-CoA thioester hydrolase
VRSSEHMPATMEHRLAVKIYLEDTDAQGIVYHANYLKYCERARTDMLGTQGYRLAEMQQRGFTFVVHEMHLKFQQPARLHDELEVRTEVQRSSAYRITFQHKVYRGEALLFKAEANVVAIGDDGKLRELPAGLFE